MHRFFVSGHALRGQRVVMVGDQAHQVRAVLRLRPGQRIVVLDDSGWEYEVALTLVTRAEATGDIVERRPATGEPGVHLTLYPAVFKWERFEWMLQKCTEVGVSRFVPVVMQRSPIQDPAVISPNKVARWQRIIVEAAEQSGRGRLPVLAPAVKLAEALADLSGAAYGLALMPWEQAEAVTVAEALSQADSPATIALFIGPEGGFTAEEVAHGRQQGAIPVTLGRRILRSETAAVVAAALVLHESGEL